MNPYLRGVLVEYGIGLIGPIPNVVIFQFNPETVTRNIQIPPRTTSGRNSETYQAGNLPQEKITLTAHFSAADQLNEDKATARMFGVGPQLAALEKMARPALSASGLLASAIDAVGSLLSSKSTSSANQSTPRYAYPKLLFIWGPFRILPVVIDSLSITEKQFDALLNPVQAEVALGFSVQGLETPALDTLAKGAAAYSDAAKTVQVTANLVGTAQQIIEIIPF